VGVNSCASIRSRLKNIPSETHARGPPARSTRPPHTPIDGSVPECSEGMGFSAGLNSIRGKTRDGDNPWGSTQSLFFLSVGCNLGFSPVTGPISEGGRTRCPLKPTPAGRPSYTAFALAILDSPFFFLFMDRDRISIRVGNDGHVANGCIHGFGGEGAAFLF
jgi:hypothetical protein